MILLWMGPVSTKNLAPAAWKGPPPTVITVNAGAGGSVGSTAFGQLAAQYTAAAGSPLRGALAAHKADPHTAEPIVVGAFSAGWGLLEHMLRSEEDRARIVAVGAFDAYYTGASKARKPGYAAFAELAAAGRKRMVMTSSHIAGPGYPASTDSIQALLDPLDLGPIPLRDVPPAKCELAAGRGALRWYVYENRAQPKQSHVQHATVLAPAFLPELVSPSRRGGGLDPLETIVALACVYLGGSELGFW